MDDELILAAFQAWGKDFDQLSAEDQALWREEAYHQFDDESFAYGVKMLQRANAITDNEKFQRGLKVPGTMVALSHVQAAVYAQFQNSYDIPVNIRDAKGGLEFLAGIHQLVLVSTAVGFLLRDAMDATDAIEKMYESEQEHEQ